MSASSYGERHAEVYDRIYGVRFSPQLVVETLARAAGDGPVLELGAGTGRLAVALAARGVTVDGIEASPAMIARLRARPGGDLVGLRQVDLAGFELPRQDYAVAVCAVSTLFMLTLPEQLGMLGSTARHLRPGGLLFVEVFVPDPTRFDDAGRRTELRGDGHVVHSAHDPDRGTITVRHALTLRDGITRSYEVCLHYRSPHELDAAAAEVGLVLRDRWHDWTGTPAHATSRDPISVYGRTDNTPGTSNTDRCSTITRVTASNGPATTHP